MGTGILKCHGHASSDSNCHADTRRGSDAYHYSDPPVAHTDKHIHTNRNAYIYPNSYPYFNANPNAYIYPKSYPYFNTNPNAYGNPPAGNAEER